MKELQQKEREWSPLPYEPTAPSKNDDDYDVIVVTDACATGWAALLWFPHTRQQVLVQQS